MELMRTDWTDDRLDDLSNRVDAGFARVDKDIRELRLDMNARFESMEDRFDQRFDAMHRTMVQFGGMMIVALIGLFAAQIGLIVTQL